MLDSAIRPVIDPPLNALAAKMHARGLSANAVTGAGFVFSLCAFAALALQAYVVAIVFILLSRLMDGLDGPLARQTAPSDLGGYYDIVSDFVFYSGVVFFFSVGRPDMALPAAFLIFSFVGTGSSFLTYAIFATKRNLNHDQQGKKAFFYLGGLTEGTESIAALLVICLFPDYFSYIAVIFGVLCWLTTIGRTMQARSTFTDARDE